MNPPKVTYLVSLVALLIVSGTAQAHISSQSPYAKGTVNTQIACTASNILFAVLQVLGFLYLGLVLRVSSGPKAPGRPSWFSAFAAAFLAQLAIALLLLACNFFVFAPLNFASTCFLINPTGFEAVSYFRPELVGYTLVSNAISLGIALLLSRALLAACSIRGNKWGLASCHALVFHPFTFPVGLLIGFMRLIYLARTAGKSPPRDALDLE